MTEAAWPWILSAVTLVGFACTARGKRWGWLVCLGSEVLWFLYALIFPSQRGFLLSVFPFAGVYLWNWIAQGRREKERSIPEMVVK